MMVRDWKDDIAEYIYIYIYIYIYMYVYTHTPTRTLCIYQLWKILPTQLMMVGDWKDDIAAGKAAGAVTCLKVLYRALLQRYRALLQE